MGREQILALSALEAVEALRYESLPEKALGYHGVETSISRTAAVIDQVRKPKLLEARP
jgi:hypothetical protein